jgi:flavin-dependent dehydrogenase
VIDLIVAGAGPAGLCTAIHAAQAGLQTVVLDPRLTDGGGLSRDIDKACGEGIMPGAIAALRGMQVELAGRPIAGIRYISGDSSVATRFRAGPGAGVRRTELQATLRARAVQLGVQLRPEAAVGVVQNDSSVTVAGLTARYLAAADGLHSPIRAELGLNAATPATQKRWGTRRHFQVQPWTDHVEVHWSADAELYVTPVAADQVGVAILSCRQAPFADLLQQFPAVSQLVAEASAGAVRGAGPLRQRSTRRVAGRVLLVGDAAGYVDALTGDGIAVAQSCAAELVRAIAADRPERYERRWLAASRRYRLITGSVLWARQQPRIAPHIVPAARRAPWLFSVAVNQLAG